LKPLSDGRYDFLIEQYLEFNKEGPQAVSGPTNSPFGANDWLVDELYQQYLEDKQSVDPAWWDFFADYSPADHSPHATAAKAAALVAPAVAQPTATVQAPAPATQHQLHLLMMSLKNLRELQLVW
jgi:2-oxoglutarate dehydrogenase complex dehydrogenase (E1) component-like enzyme